MNLQKLEDSGVKHRSCAVQSLGGFLRRRTDGRKVDRRMCVIRSNFAPCQRYETSLRVAYFFLNQFGNVTLDLVRNTVGASRFGGF